MSVRKIDLMHQCFGKDSNRRKCADCSNFIHRVGGYSKCKVYGKSCSEATDWRLSFLACGMFDQEYAGKPIVKRVVPDRPKKTICDGQLDLFGKEG